MFEHNTYQRLMDEVLRDAPEGVDTRQGSIFFDAVSAVVSKIAKLYTDLDGVLELFTITTVYGEYLDLKAAEHGMSRNPATPAKYKFEHEGTDPDLGARFFHENGYYFTLMQAEDGTLYLQAEEAGTACNDIHSGDLAVPMVTVNGMTSSTFGEVYEYGTDQESDEDLRERTMEKIAAPSENGNRGHYKTWCESVTGVGQARIFPLWNGDNTIKAVLVSPLGLPVSPEVVKAVQEYIDPNDLGMTAEVNGKVYNVGDGLGNGVANVGAHFTAAAAGSKTIDVSFQVELAPQSNQEAVKEAAEEAITEYLKDLVLASEDGGAVVVRTSAIGAILAGLTSVLVDYHELTINGSEENVTVDVDDVPVIGEVAVSVLS